MKPILSAACRTFNGTAQGQSILHRIVTEQHGGEVRLSSALNDFTGFQIVLPAGSAPAAPLDDEAA
ncbi:MAG: hypothetical protein AAF499_07000 [Pseudomonadota bacterium]